MNKYFSFFLKNGMIFQSFLLWTMAIINFNTGEFWTFAIPAIICQGLIEIINQLRKLNDRRSDDEFIF